MTNIVGKTPTHTSTTVSNVSSQVLGISANGVRRAVVLINDSDTDIYYSFGVPAVVGSGMRINANGGSILLDNNVVPFCAINAIVSSGSKNLLVTEFTA
jgi:hypothetical protein